MEKDTKKKTTKTATPKKASTTKTTQKSVGTKKTATTKTVAAKKGTASKAVTTKKTTSSSKPVSAKGTTPKKTNAPSKKVVPMEKKQNEVKAPLSKEVTKNNTILTMVVIVLVLAIVLGGSYMLSEMNDRGAYSKPSNNNTTSTTPEEIPEDEQGEYQLIGLDEYVSLKEGSELSIIYVARPTCGWCQQEGPFLRNVIYKYDAKVNYLNTDNLTKDEHSEFTKSLAEDDSYFEKGYGTPLILLVQDGKIVDKLPGYHEQDDIISFFKEYHLIGEAVK